MTRARGTGSLYRRGKVWWLKYFIDGRPVRESSHSESQEEATRLLKKRLGQAVEGKRFSPRADRVRLGDLLADWLFDLKIRGASSLPQAKIRAAHLRSFFGERRAHTLTAVDVRRYVEARKEEDIANGTINLELAALQRAYRLGLEAERIFRAPRIEMLPVNNARKGFFERQAFEAVRGHLRQEVLRDMATVAYWIGWRRSELLKLECRQVDLEHRCLRIERGITKGKEPRVVYPPSEAWAVIEKWHARRRVGTRISRYLFHRKGKPIRTFGRAWKNACRRAGYPGMLFHDFRRTAVRNMVRSGIDARVAMAITGHRTHEVFQRYNITTEADLRKAADLMNGHKYGHNAPKEGT